MIGGNERIFREFGNLLQADERDRIARTLQHARDVLTADERGEIDNAVLDMQAVSRMLTAAMLYKTDRAEGS
jgi:hypothetical protein